MVEPISYKVVRHGPLIMIVDEASGKSVFLAGEKVARRCLLALKNTKLPTGLEVISRAEICWDSA